VESRGPQSPQPEGAGYEAPVHPEDFRQDKHDRKHEVWKNVRENQDQQDYESERLYGGILPALFRGEEARHDARAVQGRDGYEIQGGQYQVYEYDRAEHFIHLSGKVNAQKDYQSDEEVEYEDEGDIGKWAREAGYHHPFGYALEVAGIDGNRFEPAEWESRDGCEDHDNQARRVQVGDWVQSEPAGIFGGRVAEEVGGITVAHFVQGGGENQDWYEYSDVEQCIACKHYVYYSSIFKLMTDESVEWAGAAHSGGIGVVGDSDYIC